MKKDLIVTTGGYVSGEEPYTENVSAVSAEALMTNLPQMLKCMTGDTVNQIEDPDHPLNGWQVNYILIEPTDEGEDDEDEDDWETIDQREDPDFEETE